MAENAAGPSNWLLMFSASWPSFSVLATTAPYQDAHSVSAHHVTESPRLLIASLVMFPSGNAEKF